jgi:hypothetical protein
MLQHLSGMIGMYMDLDHIIDVGNDQTPAILLEGEAQLSYTGGITPQQKFDAVYIDKIFIVVQNRDL